MRPPASAPPAPPSTRRPRLVVLAVVVAALLGVIALLSARPSAPPPPGPDGPVRGTVLPAPDEPTHPTIPTAEWADGVVDQRDGVVPDGVTVFDDEYPGIANVDPDLLQALRRAATTAAGDGIAFVVHSAWRSPEYQAQLLGDAVSEYGSEAEAARWVASPERSLHVSGDAVDIAGTEARSWLAQHGTGYGICRVYDNEPWHVELRPEAVDAGCPPTYADATEDPRLQPA